MSYVKTEGYTKQDALASVGPVWATLIVGIFSALNDYNERAEKPVIVEQVKEFLGGLRVYLNHYPDPMDSVVSEAEQDSYHMCEQCGGPGVLRAGSWLQTLCDEHAKGRIPTDKFILRQLGIE